jgi:hypothetical protein
MNLALRLTLVGLLLKPIGSGGLRPALLLLVAAGLAWPRALRQPVLWLALAALTGWRVVADWPLADNHAYLLAYWCLAIGLALLAPDPRRALAWNGRALVGLAFALATLWKLFSPDYLDGRFFRVALVEDPRLAPFAMHVGGLGPELLEERRAYLGLHIDGPAPDFEPPPEPARFRALAAASTFGVVALEAAVALAFLLPLAGWRHALLLLFCATTYAVAPVVSFGWLLLAMGAAQCAPDARSTRLAYLAVFGLLVLYAGLAPPGGAASSASRVW